jgi:hypothetical protein
MDLLEVDHF